MSTEIFLTMAIAVLMPISLSIYYTILIYNERRKYRRIPGPEPSGIFGYFFGNTRELVEKETNGNNLSNILFEYMKKLGSKTVKYRLFNTTIVSTCDPRLIKEVLINLNCEKSSKLYDLIGFPNGERFLGYGLVTDTITERWKHRRCLFNEGFRKQVLMTFLKEFNQKGDILIENLRKTVLQEPNKPICLLQKFNQIAIDIIASIAFSMDIDSVNDPNNMFNQYIFQALEGLNYFFRDPLIKLKPHKWSFIKRHREIVRHLRDIGRKQITSRIEAFKNGGELPNDILSVILKSYESENKEFFVEDMVDEFITFFIAGQETTATTLAFMFMEIGRNPEVFKKVKEEIDNVIGDKTELLYEDLSKLVYSSCIFKESLRLYPPVPNVSRTYKEDIVLDDITIPKNSWIMVNIFACGHNDEFFENPSKFDPDRFLKKQNQSVQNYTYFPFSLGPRSCIGQNFAQIEAKLLLAKFIQNFEFKLDPEQSFEMKQAGTLRPKDGTRCYIIPRY